MILNVNGRPATPADEAELAEAEKLIPTEECVLVPLRALDPNTQAMRLKALQAAAHADDHMVVAPTHVMMRGKEVVGYLSLNGMPMVHCWFDSKVKNPRHSKDMIRHGETAFRESGVQQYLVACAKSSPFAQYMQQLGFACVGETVLWGKNIKY